MMNVWSPNQDLISDLPSNITEYILMRLPLRDAVRTSILSSNWRYKWVTLPHLEFDYHLCLEVQKLKTIVYQILLNHRGPIFKFTLRSFELESCSDINQWILFLSKNAIQEFTLRLHSIIKHTLPSHFFSFVHLRCLILSNCVFKPPPTFKGFSKLVNLDFQRVVIVPEMFGSFVSNCPLLERLEFLSCTNFDCLEINAPNLKKFHFHGIFKSICFQNTALLAEISISLIFMDRNMEWYHEQGEKSNLTGFLHCLPAMEKLSVCKNFLEFLAIGGVPKRLPSTLNHLKILDLSLMSVDKIDGVSCALCLIRSAPNLQELEITTSTFADRPDTVREHVDVVDFLRVQDFSNCSLKRLWKVKMGLDFSGLAPALELIKLLLVYSTELEKMKIYLIGDSRNVESMMLKKLIQYPRASPKAEIIYLDN